MGDRFDDDDSLDGVSFHDRLEFWGLQVPPNKDVKVEFGEADEELVHITQARKHPPRAVLGSQRRGLRGARPARDPRDERAPQLAPRA